MKKYFLFLALLGLSLLSSSLNAVTINGREFDLELIKFVWKDREGNLTRCIELTPEQILRLNSAMINAALTSGMIEEKTLTFDLTETVEPETAEIIVNVLRAETHDHVTQETLERFITPENIWHVLMGLDYFQAPELLSAVRKFYVRPEYLQTFGTLPIDRLGIDGDESCAATVKRWFTPFMLYPRLACEKTFDHPDPLRHVFGFFLSFTGEHGGLVSVAWSPDEHYIASMSQSTIGATAEETVNIWDSATGTCVRALHFQADLDNITHGHVTWSFDGALLAFVDNLNIVRIFNMQTGATEELPRDDSRPARAIAWAPNCNLLAIESFDCVRIWDVAARKYVKGMEFLLYRDFWHSLHALAWSSDGKLLACAHPEASNVLKIDIWDLETNRLIKTLTEPKFYGINSLAWSSDNQYLASSQLTRINVGSLSTLQEVPSVIVWNVVTGVAEHTMNQCPGPVRWVSHEPLLLAGSRLIDVKSGKVLVDAVVDAGCRVSWSPSLTRCATYAYEKIFLYHNPAIAELKLTPSQQLFILLCNQTTQFTPEQLTNLREIYYSLPHGALDLVGRWVSLQFAGQEAKSKVAEVLSSLVPDFSLLKLVKGKTVRSSAPEETKISAASRDLQQFEDHLDKLINLQQFIQAIDFFNAHEPALRRSNRYGYFRNKIDEFNSRLGIGSSSSSSLK